MEGGRGGLGSTRILERQRDHGVLGLRTSVFCRYILAPIFFSKTKTKTKTKTKIKIR